MGEFLFSPEWALVKDLAADSMAPAHPSEGHDGSNDTQFSFEKIKKQLTGSSETVLLQGPLLKRSQTLRKWNQRWFTLDPSTGKMEYRTQRGDATPRGLVIFEANSTITMSPLNLHPAKKYEGCCFYIGTPQRQEYFLCADTPDAAKAWVSTLRSVALVLKAHKEAVNSLCGNGQAKTGTVAAAVASANSTAKEASKEIAASLQNSMKALLHLGSSPGIQVPDSGADDLSVLKVIMKETLRVKDEELQQMARELRARDHTIKELSDRLHETAEAAEAAAAAATALHVERRAASAELEQMYQQKDDYQRAGESRLVAALNAAEKAMQEAQGWRTELGKARERILELEAALIRSQEESKCIAAEAAASVHAAKESESAATFAKESAFQQLALLQDEAGRLSNMVQFELRQDVAEEGQFKDGSSEAPVDIHAHVVASAEPLVDIHDHTVVAVAATADIP